VRIRGLIVQLVGGWLGYRPARQFNLWFRERFGEGEHLRRGGIVALAPRLLIARWG
jgi:hypothetical protein